MYQRPYRLSFSQKKKKKKQSWKDRLNNQNKILSLFKVIVHGFYKKAAISSEKENTSSFQTFAK